MCRSALMAGRRAAAGIGERLTPVESHLAAVAGDHQAEGGVLHPGHVPADRRDGREPAAALYYPRGGKGSWKRASLAGLCGSLYNVFEEVTALPELSEIRQELRQSGALAAMMTGSGSAVFGIFPEEDAAKVVAEKMAESRWAICCRGIN